MELQLLHGCVLIYDAEDSAIVDAHKWYAIKHRYTWYAISTDHPQVKLHRILLGAEPGQLVDHINGNGLDNRRSNIRFATVMENNRNKRPQKSYTSQFKGVCCRYAGKALKWVARISVEGKRIQVGEFDTEAEAAKAYNVAAETYYGHFARLNVGDLPEHTYKHERRPKTSQFKGVYWNTAGQRWQAQIKIKGHNYGLGRFKTEEAAAQAYKDAEEKRELCQTL